MNLRQFLDAITPPDGRENETGDQWTERAIADGAARGVNRWCSFGVHEDCSDPDGDSCRCVCHMVEAPSYGDLCRWLRSELLDGDVLRERAGVDETWTRNAEEPSDG